MTHPNVAARVADSSRATSRPEYAALIARLQDRVPSLIRKGSHVLVVSRGDDELLKLRGLHTAHYPQAEDGRYAGHYPADSDGAISHLESLRASGAEYLLFPAPALWWLDYYEDFVRHLTEQYREVHRDEDLVLFQLAEAREGPALGDPRGAILDARWAQLASVLDAVLPAAAPIVLLSEAEPALPHTAGRRVLHVAASSTGSQPSDSAGEPFSIALRDAIRSGIRYVIVPRFGDPAKIDGTLSTLRARYRLLLDQAGVCAAFEAIPIGRATIHQLKGSSSIPAPSSSPRQRGGRHGQA